MTTNNRSIIEADNKTISFPLSNLPKETRQDEIYPRSPLSALGLLAQTSKQYEAETAFLRLLQASIHAAPEFLDPKKDATALASIAMLKKHPDLLFRKKQVTDHFGRQIWASPYQLFLGAGDVWAVEQVHKHILHLILNGEKQAEAQFKEQFPNCPWPLPDKMSEEALYDKRNKDQIARVKEQLKTIVEKITADPCTNGQATKDETTTAVAELCQIFAPKEGEVIKTGLHFPLAIMREIYSVCDAQFDPWISAQLSFFSRAVIGAAEVALTAVDGQCCKNGLRKLNMEKGPDRRDGLFCRHPKGIPQELAPIADKLGRSMFVDPDDGESCFLSAKPGVFDCYDKDGPAGGRVVRGVAWRWGLWWALRLAFWKTYGEKKQRHMGAIMQPIFDASTYRLGDHDQQVRYVIV